MRHFVSFLDRFRFAIALILLVLSSMFLFFIGEMGLKMDNSPERFAAKNDARFVEFQEFQKEFGRDDAFAFVIQGAVLSAEYTRLLLRLGFRSGAFSPCNFSHAARELSATVHGDDFLV